ncbi:right-handed parallel beta-helix repeat-containing protein [Leucothrix arctica]|uniref:Right handed beta helix domain-containing protein n=1 Tax=Leucothrix arctica TaxID=1481894 RepID=A0A317CEG0_9GAMM|nr:right-handed parallel beta-helix repeat-containing protein [Leucothrix arctica]PWQ94690.1 hypothetical protein DKT75_15475 [Leucothrix arctica]
MKRFNLSIKLNWMCSLGLSLLLTAPASHAALTDYTEVQQQAYQTIAQSLSEQNETALTAELIEPVTYWVDAVNGIDDFARTGQIDQPWKSITWAFNNIPFANDTANIVVRAGTYSPAVLYVGQERGGNAEETLPFNLIAYPADTVVLDGTNVADNGAMISIASASNVSISGLQISNITGTGKSAIYIANSDKITISNNSIHDSQWTTDTVAAISPTLADRLNGVAVVGTSTDITVENNNLYNLVTGYGEPILVLSPAVATVSNNITYGNDPEFFENQQYYVSTAGDDDLGIGTLEQPWQTVHKALFSIPFGEDNATINIREGTYQIPTAMYFDVSRGGADGKYFTVKSYEGETAVIDGGLLTTDFGAMVSVSSGAYVRIEGLSFTNLTGPKSGIYITGSSHHVALIDNKIFGMTWADDEGEDESAPTPSDNLNPIAVIGNNATTPLSDIIIRGNEMYDIVPGYSEGIKIVGNVTNFLVEDNEVRDIANIGIVAAGNYTWVLDDAGVLIPADVNHARNGIIRNNVVSNAVSPIANSAGIYLDGAHNVLVEGNTSHSNSVGYSIGSEQPGTAQDNTLKNNVAYDNSDAGLVVGTVHADATVVATLVEGNEFKNNYRKGGYGGEVTIQQVDGLVIQQNSFESLTDVVIVASQPATNITMNNNTYSSLSADPDALVFDWGGITGTSYIGLDQFQAQTCLDLNSAYEGSLTEATNTTLTQCSTGETDDEVVEEVIEEEVTEEETTDEVVDDSDDHKNKHNKKHKNKNKDKKNRKNGKNKANRAKNDAEWDERWEKRQSQNSK